MPYTELLSLREEDYKEQNYLMHKNKNLATKLFRIELETLFNMLTFNNYENSVSDLVLRKNLNRDLDMICKP